MAVMKALDMHIKEHSAEDNRVYELLRWIINQHLQGFYELDQLPNEAIVCMQLWEKEQEFMYGLEDHAKRWEEQRAAEIHRDIDHAVKNGILTYDQGMELINDPAKAEQWKEKGVL